MVSKKNNNSEVDLVELINIILQKMESNYNYEFKFNFNFNYSHQKFRK